MVRGAAIAAALLCIATSGVAFERPISESMSEQLSAQDVARFISRRCSGLYMFLAGNAGDPDLEAELTLLTSAFMQRAYGIQLLYGAEPDNAMTATVQGVIRIAEIYKELGSESMAASGQYLPEGSVAAEDVDFCGIIAQQLPSSAIPPAGAQPGR